MKPQRLLIDISWRALFKVILLTAGLVLAYQLRDVLMMLLIVFIFVAAVTPTIARLQVYVSRPLAVTIFYLSLIAVLALIFYVLLPTLVIQLESLIQSLPSIYDRTLPYFQSYQLGHAGIVDQILGSVTSSLQHLSQNVVDTTYSVFGTLATIITGIILSFYLLLEEKNTGDFFHQVLPPHHFEAVYTTVSKITTRMGSWVRGQLLIMLIIGISNFIGYLIVGVPSPLPLAIWSGLAEAIPVIGTTLGMIPAIAVALATHGWVQALIVFGISFGIVQQIEMHIIVPRLMGKAVGLSPVLVILALLIGVKLAGLAGALIAVPTAAIISVIVGEWPSLRKAWDPDSAA